VRGMIGKPESPRRRLDDNIKMYVKNEMGGSRLDSYGSE
jgi:hypothetical protein